MIYCNHRKEVVTGMNNLFNVPVKDGIGIYTITNQQSGIVTEYRNKHSQIMPDQMPEGLAFCVFKMPYYNIIYINIMGYEYL